MIPDRKAFGAVRFCYVPQEMTIGSIGFDSRQLPNGVDLAIVLAGSGQRHAPPPPAGRVALVTAVGDSEADVRAVIAAAESALRIVEAAPVRAAVGRPRNAGRAVSGKDCDSGVIQSIR